MSVYQVSGPGREVEMEGCVKRERRAYCGMAGTRRCAVLASARRVRDLTFERSIAFLGLLDCLAALMQLVSARRTVTRGRYGCRIS
jgi:hypothetical protein